MGVRGRPQHSRLLYASWQLLLPPMLQLVGATAATPVPRTPLLLLLWLQLFFSVLLLQLLPRCVLGQHTCSLGGQVALGEVPTVIQHPQEVQPRL
jgi:hypothetical protein